MDHEQTENKIIFASNINDNYFDTIKPKFEENDYFYHNLLHFIDINSNLTLEQCADSLFNKIKNVVDKESDFVEIFVQVIGRDGESRLRSHESHKDVDKNSEFGKFISQCIDITRASLKSVKYVGSICTKVLIVLYQKLNVFENMDKDVDEDGNIEYGGIEDDYPYKYMLEEIMSELHTPLEKFLSASD